jgi:hypothetical protein
MDYIVLGGVVAAVLQLLYTAIPYHAARRSMSSDVEPKSNLPRRHFAIMGVLALISWGAIGYDFYDRRSFPPEKSEAVIQEYGLVSPNSFRMVFDGSRLATYARDYKAALIVHVAYMNLDRMTDAAIGKSDLYTITDGFQAIAKTGTEWMRAPAGAPGTFMINVSYYLVVLPNGFTMDQIKNLSDVSHVGGKIIASRGRGDSFDIRPINPPDSTFSSPGPPK